jgi:hypothetical protein
LPEAVADGFRIGGAARVVDPGGDKLSGLVDVVAEESLQNLLDARTVSQFKAYESSGG